MTTVGIDAAVDNGGFAGQSSRSWSHTVGSGTNRAIYVACCFWNNGGSVSTVTYGGVSLTRVLQSSLSTSNDRVEVWRLLNPTSGAATVAVTFSTAADGETASLSFDTVHQTTPERNTGSTTGSSNGPTISATGAQTGDAILDALCWEDRSIAATMGTQTNRVQRFNTTAVAGEGGAGSTVTTAPTPQTMNWTFAGGNSRVHALGYVVIANDGGGAAQDTPELYGRPSGIRGQNHMQQLLAT